MPRSLIALLLVLFYTSTSAANDGTESRMIALRNAYAKMHGFSAEFTQTLTNAEAKSTEIRNGTIRFRKPFLVRWETLPPTKELLIVTPNAVWDYFPDEEIAYSHSPDVVKDARTLISIITGQHPLERDFLVEKADDTDGLCAFRLYPKEATTQMTEVLILVNPTTNLLDTVEITDFYNNTNKVCFRRIISNAKVEKDVFSFQPPKGVKIEVVK